MKAYICLNSRPFSPLFFQRNKQTFGKQNHWSVCYPHALSVSHSPRAYTQTRLAGHSLTHSASVCLFECICVYRKIETGLAVRKLLAASSALANVGHYATYSNAETDSRERKRGRRSECGGGGTQCARAYGPRTAAAANSSSIFYSIVVAIL